MTKRSASEAFPKPSHDETESRAETLTIEASSGSAERELAAARSCEFAGGDELPPVSLTTVHPAGPPSAQAAVAASSLTPPLPLVADGDAAAGPPGPPESDYYSWHWVPSPVRRRPRLHRSQPISAETWTLIEESED